MVQIKALLNQIHDGGQQNPQIESGNRRASDRGGCLQLQRVAMECVLQGRANMLLFGQDVGLTFSEIALHDSAMKGLCDLNKIERRTVRVMQPAETAQTLAYLQDSLVANAAAAQLGTKILRLLRIGQSKEIEKGFCDCRSHLCNLIGPKKGAAIE